MSYDEPRNVMGIACRRADFAAKVAQAVRLISGAATETVQLPNVRQECKARVEIAARHIEAAEPDDIRIAGLFQRLTANMRWKPDDAYDPSPSSAHPMPAQHQLLAWFGTNAKKPHSAKIPNRCAPEDLLVNLLHAAGDDAVMAEKAKNQALDERLQRAEGHRADVEELREEIGRLQGQVMERDGQIVTLTHGNAALVRERDLARAIADGAPRKRATSLEPEAEAEAEAAAAQAAAAAA